MEFLCNFRVVRPSDYFIANYLKSSITFVSLESVGPERSWQTGREDETNLKARTDKVDFKTFFDNMLRCYTAAST